MFISSLDLIHAVPRRARHHDAVLNGQLVRGQALEVPLADLGLVDEEPRHVEVLRDRDAALDAVAVKVAAQEQIAELLVERAEVGHERRRERAVARESLDLQVELLRLLRPAHLLPRERGDERRRGFHLPLARRGVVLERLLLRHRRVELGLHLVEVRLHFRELVLRGLLRLHRNLELRLRGSQHDDLRVDNLRDEVVRLHRLAPVAQTRDGAGRLLRHLEVEVRGLQVRLEELARLVVDLLLRKRHQLAQKLRVAHHLHRDVFVVVRAVDDHRALDVVPRHRRRHRELSQHEHRVEDALDDVGRVFQRLERADVLRRD
jgi:hypothetical protein